MVVPQFVVSCMVVLGTFRMLVTTIKRRFFLFGFYDFYKQFFYQGYQSKKNLGQGHIDKYRYILLFKLIKIFNQFKNVMTICLNY